MHTLIKQSTCFLPQLTLDGTHKTAQGGRAMPKKPPYNHVKQLGGNIRKAREGRQMTQLALAHALGYQGPDAGAYISRIEASIVSPRLSTLMRIAEKLQTNLEALVAK